MKKVVLIIMVLGLFISSGIISSFGAEETISYYQVDRLTTSSFKADSLTVSVTENSSDVLILCRYDYARKMLLDTAVSEAGATSISMDNITENDKVKYLRLKSMDSLIPVQNVKVLVDHSQTEGAPDITSAFIGNETKIYANSVNDAQYPASWSWGVGSGSYTAPSSPVGAINLTNMSGVPAKPNMYIVIDADKDYDNVTLSATYTSYNGVGFVSQGFTYSSPKLSVNGSTIDLMNTCGDGLPQGWGVWRTDNILTVDLKKGENKIPISWLGGWICIDYFTVKDSSNFSVSPVFTDSMVLQREREVNIWGTGNNDAVVTASIGNYNASETVANGKWLIKLPAMEANTTGQALMVSCGSKTITYDDVLIGDVFFVDGQSNADFTFSSTDTYAADVLLANVNNIRFFYQNRWDLYHNAGAADLAFALTPQENPINAAYKWEVSSTTTVGKISAIGYYFAKFVTDEVNVPVGFIQVASGGAQLKDLSPAQINATYGTTGGDANYVYNALMHPVEKFTTRGMLWYQGESDSSSELYMNTYAQRFNDFVNYIEDASGSDIDVFNVQLSSHSGTSVTSGWQVARFRAIQYAMQSEKNFMAVSMDKGVRIGDADTAHPKYKKEVGRRLANLALAKIYNTVGFENASSPMPETITYDSTGVTITFKNVVEGLLIAKDSTLKGFELISGTTAAAATATITSANTVRITGVSNPTGVRYGYYIEASQLVANLINSNGLPCPTFANGTNANTIAPISNGQMEDVPDSKVAFSGSEIKIYANFVNDAEYPASWSWGPDVPTSPVGAINLTNMQGAPTKPNLSIIIDADKDYTGVGLSAKYTAFNGTDFISLGFVYSQPKLSVKGTTVNLTTTTGPGQFWGIWRTDNLVTLDLKKGDNIIPINWLGGWICIDYFTIK